MVPDSHQPASTSMFKHWQTTIQGRPMRMRISSTYRGCCLNNWEIPVSKMGMHKNQHYSKAEEPISFQKQLQKGRSHILYQLQASVSHLGMWRCFQGFLGCFLYPMVHKAPASTAHSQNKISLLQKRVCTHNASQTVVTPGDFQLHLTKKDIKVKYPT